MSTARHRRHRVLRRTLLACILAAGLGTARAQAVGSDAAAKAKLVTTLARFVHWPATSFDGETAALRLCVFSGSLMVERAFQSQAAAAIGGHPVQIIVNPRALSKNCQVLFVDDGGPEIHMDQVVKRLGSEPVFTVGTQDGFVSEGGMVEIVRIDNALRFDVNLVALREAGLGVHPGVLKLARQVRQ